MLCACIGDLLPLLIIECCVGRRGGGGGGGGGGSFRGGFFLGVTLDFGLLFSSARLRGVEPLSFF